ncbi:MAG: multidrug efflux pump subunit AcrB, partial [Myxococcota bacterium]
EVEQGIVLVIEEEVRGIDGVKRVNGTAAEGAGAVTVELLIDADPDRVLSDIKTAVDGITSFPEDAEKSQVALVSVAPQVITMIISGDVSRATLHGLAEKARADLLADPEITQVTTAGLPPLEISIEISRETLESYGMTLDEVAAQIRFASLELPGGGIDTEGGEILVRVSDRALSGSEFGEIVLRSTATGARVRLSDIATITDGFAETDQGAYFNGKPAVQVISYRVGDETPTSVATAVKDYAATFAPTLPDTVQVDLWDDDSEMLEGRISLLLDNARVGILLVVAILALFLDIRLAFWVALGIPICFLGAFLILPAAGVSVNMVSLFAFIITLGLVVDDAIVVGENTFARREQGLSWSESAVAGSREMSVPVTFAILTTVAAFAPLTMVPGFMGKIFGIIPTVVVVILMLSLIESFFILPAHLAHTSSGPPGAIRRFFDRPRIWVTGKLEIFNKTRYQPALEAVLRQRYISLAVAGALFIISIGMVASGTVAFSFFPKLEGNNVQVNARLTYGAPIEQTDMVREQVEAALQRAIERMPEGMVIGQYTTVGQSLAGGGPGGSSVTTGSHLMSVAVELIPSEDRELSSADFGAAWSEELPRIPGVEALSVVSSSGPGAGAAVDVQLSHSNIDMLAAASAEIAATLQGYDTLTDVVNEYSAGKEQLDFSVNDQGRNLGLTGNDIARQIRGAFFGSEALREQRGRNEIKVMVRLPREQRRSEYDIEQLKVRTPAGGFVPLAYVADLDRGQAPTTINREEGRRIVNISAELASGVVSSQETVTGLRTEVFPALLEKYPGLGVELVGEQREQQESLSSLGTNYFFALFAIYALLAIPFKSYTQPLVIMSAIPFGFIGAIAGHLIMGFELSIISMMGIVALTGVVVNDSLVLMDAANRARAEGQSAWDAIIYGGTRRLRPIFLTSMTTFLGLAPMIMETSVQARFLIPMAISLGFGVLFSTGIILLLVPALYLVLEDAKVLFARLRGDTERHEVVVQPAK